MSVNISQAVTDIWPVTERTLLNAANPSDSTEIDYYNYADAKIRAINRAKRDLYEGTGVDIPADEADIPDVAAYWIADQAVVHLIALAKDFYMVMHRRSDSKEQANFTYYDKVASLDALKNELEADLRAKKDMVLDAINASQAPESVYSTPAVSTVGMLVDPVNRARLRGPY